MNCLSEFKGGSIGWNFASYIIATLTSCKGPEPYLNNRKVFGVFPREIVQLFIGLDVEKVGKLMN